MTAMRPLTESECWEHLGSRRVGRIGFDRGRGQRIHPVNYAVDSRALYLMTSPESELGMFSALFASGAQVAFQIDELDEDAEQWSVLVLGQLEPMDAAEAGGVPGLRDPAPGRPEGHDALVLRLTPVQVTGRRRGDS
jgi:nitroimidazol reductase NimA-like FMN-containing flavoprotein (pyridoxamine 5'-phosphate oxidase superfamily)